MTKRKKLWNAIAGDYVSQLNPGGQAVDFYILNKIQEDINKLDKLDRILDVGCGNGVVTNIAKEMLEQKSGKKINYVGVDISDEMIKLAKSKFGDKDNLSFYSIDEKVQKFKEIEDESIDLAMAHWVYPTCDSLDMIRQSFKEVYRVLKPGRRFYFSAHNLEETIGVPLSTWANGAPGRKYKTEDKLMIAFYEKDDIPRPSDLQEWYDGKNPKGTLVFEDSTFFPKDYERLAQEAGFKASYEKVRLTKKEIEMTKKIFKERAPDFTIEEKISPALMFVLEKKKIS